MWLKELLCVFYFGSTILGASGLALKVNKFEHNYLINNQLFLTLDSYKKLNPKVGKDFYFFDESNREKILRISQIESIDSDSKKDLKHTFIKFSFLNLDESNNSNENFLIKYYLESKSLWANLIN